MNNIDYNIEPLKGLGELKFGLTQDEVKKMLGEPDNIENFDEDFDIELNPDETNLDEIDEDFNTIIFDYDDIKTTLFFESEESCKLSCVETFNENTTIYGKKAFELTENELIELMKEHNFSEIDISEEEWGEKRISFDDALIDFYFENGKLSTINFGAIID